MRKVRCSRGYLTRAAGPIAMGAPTQYGTGVHALAVNQLVHQHVPSLWTALGAADLHGAHLSEGFVHAALQRAVAALAPFLQHAAALLQDDGVAHSDESGIRVGAALHSVHVACTAHLTWYTAHAKRGREAMAHAGELPHFVGTLVTDAWAPYRSYGTARAVRFLHDLTVPLYQQPRRAGHPHGQDPEEGLRRLEHPRRSPALAPRALLPLHRPQTRPQPHDGLPRPRHRSAPATTRSGVTKDLSITNSPSCTKCS